MLQKRHIFTIILLNVVLGALVYLQTQGSSLFQAAQPQPPQSVAPLKTVLKDSWTFYKGQFMKDGERVVSNTFGGTISEGQSYALLKSVWMNDPETFRRVWQWTKTHMQRPQDHLLGWRWGKKEDGFDGILNYESATDADEDIAYSLLLAGEQWNNPEYTQDALAMINDLWRVSVRKISGKYYLLPGDWDGFSVEYQTLDPAYFAPYVYRKFAQYDRLHNWNQLADDIYDTLEACTNLTAPKLPPNWCAITYVKEGETPQVIFSDRQGETSRNFGYDSFRVFWRMAMDAKLSSPEGQEKAKAYLKRHQYLLTYWQKNKRMPEGFSPDGKPLGNAISAFTIGPLLVTSHFQNSQSTAELYQETLAKFYNPEGYWDNDYNDYLHSVVWLHLYSLSLQ
jgi:endo-1,4-beta-D-glucanase Y